MEAYLETVAVLGKVLYGVVEAFAFEMGSLPDVSSAACRDVSSITGGIPGCWFSILSIKIAQDAWWKKSETRQDERKREKTDCDEK